jgi:hypothetical protein
MQVAAYAGGLVSEKTTLLGDSANTDHSPRGAVGASSLLRRLWRGIRKVAD